MERSCVVCREVGDKSVLLRFVLSSPSSVHAPTLTMDLEGCLPGRGAYCHATLRCLSGKDALQKLERALKRGQARVEGPAVDGDYAKRAECAKGKELGALISEALERCDVAPKSGSKSGVKKRAGVLIEQVKIIRAQLETSADKDTKKQQVRRGKGVRL